MADKQELIEIAKKMKKVAEQKVPDEMSNREYWLRTELWQFAEDIEEEANRVTINVCGGFDGHGMLKKLTEVLGAG